VTRKVKIEAGALLGLLIVAGLCWSFYFRASVGAADSASSAVANYKAMPVENPRIHWSHLAESQQTQYETVGRDIFTGSLPKPAEPTPAPARSPEPGDHDYVAPPPPPPPPPPQLPLKYFGYGSVEEGQGRRAFLTDGGAVYIAAEGDTILGHFRVIKISHTTVEFEEIRSGRHGVATIEDQGPAF
jgi:hypothetical protein